MADGVDPPSLRPTAAIRSIPFPAPPLCVACLSLLPGNRDMFGRNEVSDKTLLKSVNQRLERTGTGSQSKVQGRECNGAMSRSQALCDTTINAPPF